MAHIPCCSLGSYYPKTVELSSTKLSVHKYEPGPLLNWILCFFEKIRSLETASSFLVSEEAQTSFETLKRDIEESVVCAMEECVAFEVETDASVCHCCHSQPKRTPGNVLLIYIAKI